MKDDITYVVWTEGDPSTGIEGCSAEVTMHKPSNAEMDEHTRESLKVCFEDIWDFPCFVMTDEEINRGDD